MNNKKENEIVKNPLNILKEIVLHELKISEEKLKPIKDRREK